MRVSVKRAIKESIHFLYRWLLEIVTIASAIIALLAPLFDWFKLDENVYRNIVLALTGILLLIIIRARIELKAQHKFTDALSDELNEWRSALKLTSAQIDPPDISKRLQSTLEEAKSWAFSGGTGSWQRTNVLPILSRVTEGDVSYRMQVVNILDEQLCETYAHYRLICKQDSGTDRRSLTLEILSSVLAACWYKAFSRIEPVVCFSTDYSPLRYDMSQSVCFITAANRSDPGLMFRSGSWIFSHLDDEFVQDSKTLPRLDLSNAVNELKGRGKSTPLDTGEVRAVLDRVKVVRAKSNSALLRGLKGADFTDHELQRIWERSGVNISN
ncbi:hypothetical protein [Mycolicibacterium porcinum]